MDVCSEIHTILDEHLSRLRDYQFKVWKLLANRTYIREKTNVKRTKRGFITSPIRRIFRRYLFAYLRKRGYIVISENNLKRMLVDRMPIQPRTLSNFRAIELLKDLTDLKKRKEYIEICENLGDQLSRLVYVDYLKLILNSALSTSPFSYLTNLKTINPSKVDPEKHDIKMLGKGKYVDLYDIKGLFKIEALPSLIKEVFIAENYRDEYHDIVPKDNIMYIDVGACFGENIAWFALYSSDSLAYAIEGDKKHLEVLKENIFSKERVKPFLESKNVRVVIKNVIVNETTPLERIIKENEIGKVNEVFLKSDIEGAERKLLDVSRRFLSQYTPTLSIAAYHHGDDLLVLPKIVLEAYDGYKIFFKPKIYDIFIIMFAKV